MPGTAKRETERVEVTVHRTVVVLGVDDKPAVELTAAGNEVRVALLPRNASRRSPVGIGDLTRAVEALKA